MKRLLYYLAAIALAGSILLWGVTGGNMGWTKTSDVIKTLDPVTGIEGITYRKAFHPGVDFLGAALILTLLLAAAAYILPLKAKKSPL